MPCLHWAAPPPSPCPYMRPHNCPHNCPHARPRTPANVAWCVCTNVRTFSPQVRVHASAGRRVERTMCTPGTLVSVRGTQAAKSSRWAFASVARVCHRLPSPRDGRRLGQKTRRVSLEFGSERACAPPALSALNLGRLLRVVLPVKRDCSVDNPNSPGDYSSCAHEE